MENDFLKTEQDKASFLEAILNPAEPNEALKKAMLRYKQAIESGELIVSEEKISISCDCDTTDPSVKSIVQNSKDYLDEQGLPKLSTGLPKEKTLIIKKDGK